MNKYLIILVLATISCSSDKEKPIQENFSSDEVIASDIEIYEPDFSERFQSFDSENPIWQYNEEYWNPEERIEKINEDNLLFKGQKLKDILDTRPYLEAYESVPIRTQNVMLADSSTIVLLQNGEITSLSFTKGSELKYENRNLFSYTPISYKKEFPGSYQMRNFTTSHDDVMRYREIDSVKSLDFTHLYTDSGKLTITWVNGNVERVFYDYYR